MRADVDEHKQKLPLPAAMLLISNARGAWSPTQLYDPCASLGGGGFVTQSQQA